MFLTSRPPLYVSRGFGARGARVALPGWQIGSSCPLLLRLHCGPIVLPSQTQPRGTPHHCVWQTCNLIPAGACLRPCGTLKGETTFLRSIWFVTKWEYFQSTLKALFVFLFLRYGKQNMLAFVSIMLTMLVVVSGWHDSWILLGNRISTLKKLNTVISAFCYKSDWLLKVWTVLSMQCVCVFVGGALYH